MSLFLSCGEASGDHYAGCLIKALDGRLGRCWGMLGPEGTTSGGHEVWSYSELQVMGISEGLKSLLRLSRLKDRMANSVLKEMPDCVVVIDSPDYHIPLIKAIRRKGYRNPIFYVSPPTAWAWRAKRADVIRDLEVTCFPLFEFEHRFYTDKGVESRWMGHPLLDDLCDYTPDEDVMNAYSGKRIVALLPGSRSTEVRRLAPVLREVVVELKRMGYNPVVSVAKSLPSVDRQALKGMDSGLSFFEGKGVDLMYVSEFVIGACGTAAVEAMMLDKFMVALYKASFLSYLVYKLMVKTQWVAMPNILLGREVYPELLQGEVKASSVLEAVLRYLKDTTKVHNDLAKARSKMGDRGAYKFWADVIAKTVGR